MSSGYTKLFASILDSTVWGAPHHVRIVWMTLLAMADRDGMVESSIPGLVRRAVVSRAECEEAIAYLMAPDLDSRSPDHEGRRIAPVDSGWQVLNYVKFRERASLEERREKDAARQQAKRDREAPTRDASGAVRPRPSSSVVVRPHPQSHDIADADADAEADPKRESTRERAESPPLELDDLKPIQFPKCPGPERVLNIDDVLGFPPDDKPPSQRPDLIATRVYRHAYEAARGVLWMQHGKFTAELVQLGDWAEAQARLDGKTTEAVIVEVLRNAFLDNWMISKGFPLSAIVKQLGELYRPPPRAGAPPRVIDTRAVSDWRNEIEHQKRSRKPDATLIADLERRIAAEYASPTGAPDEPQQRRSAHR